MNREWLKTHWGDFTPFPVLQTPQEARGKSLLIEGNNSLKSISEQVSPLEDFASHPVQMATQNFRFFSLLSVQETMVTRTSGEIESLPVRGTALKT